MLRYFPIQRDNGQSEKWFVMGLTGAEFGRLGVKELDGA